MYHVSAQGIDERMINVHYYYYYGHRLTVKFGLLMHGHRLTGLVFFPLQAVASDPLWP